MVPGVVHNISLLINKSSDISHPNPTKGKFRSAYLQMSSAAIPKFQTAAWIDTPGPNTKPYLRYDIPIPTPSNGEVLVKLDCTGVCHSDVHAILGETKRMAVHIGGHEGVGKVISLGPLVPSSFLNTRVGVKWLYSSCLSCEVCAVNYIHCPNQSNSGRNVPGTFQQYVVAPAKFVTQIPDELESSKAAPLLCAGLTVFGAIKKAGLKPGEWMVIMGAGGGLGHLGVQIARKMALRVIAVGSGEKKRTLCTKLGAELFLDYRVDDVERVVKDLTNGYGAHAVICATGNDAAYAQALQLVRIMGTVVCVGLSQSTLTVSPLQVAIRGLKIVGSTVGTEEDMDELLRMAVAGDVVPEVEVFELERLHDVVQRIADGTIVGKAVMNLSF